MKLGIISDVHLPTQGTLPRPAQAGDVMVLAGDIGVGLAGVSWAKTVFTCPVIYVPGNHEYYNRSIDTLDGEMREYVAGTDIHILQDTQVVIDGVRFIGATLWTDFALFGNVGESALLAQHGMSDYYVIRKRFRAVKPSETLALHQVSRTNLQRTLAEPFDGPTVVVTHHAPSLKSIAPRFVEDPLTPCYASDLEALVASSGAVYWIHGHVHDSVDYVLGKTRVIANPRGYRGEEKERESLPFRWDFTVEV